MEQTGDPWDTNGDGKIDEQDKPTVNTYHSVTLTTPDGANSYPTQSLRGVDVYKRQAMQRPVNSEGLLRFTASSDNSRFSHLL